MNVIAGFGLDCRDFKAEKNARIEQIHKGMVADNFPVGSGKVHIRK